MFFSHFALAQNIIHINSIIINNYVSLDDIKKLNNLYYKIDNNKVININIKKNLYREKIIKNKLALLYL